MTKPFLFPLIIVAAFITGCPKDANVNTGASALHGIWVIEGDVPGRQPADTLLFVKKSNKDMLSFHFSATAGANWPADVETEYKFENGKLTLKDFSGGTHDFIPVESFQWVIPNKEFRAKLYQIVHYMSADYRVTYRKVN